MYEKKWSFVGIVTKRVHTYRCVIFLLKNGARLRSSFINWEYYTLTV